MSRYQTIVVACFPDDLQRTIHNKTSHPLVEQAFELKALLASQTFKQQISPVRVIFAHWMHLSAFPILEDNLISDIPGVWSNESTHAFQEQAQKFKIWLDEWLNFYCHTRPEFFDDNMLDAETENKITSEQTKNGLSVQVMPGDIELELGGFLKQHSVDLVIISTHQSEEGSGDYNPKTILLQKLGLPAGKEILGSCDLLCVN